MKYTGRIVMTSLVLLLAAGEVATINTNDEILFTHTLWWAIPTLIVSWLLGKQYDKVKFFSERDHLTQAYNRRYVNDFFAKWARKKHKDKLALFFVDIDDFKSINDQYGHEMGDNAICCISKSLLAHTRKHDIVSRWGGDEFLFIAPKIDSKNSIHIFRRIQEEIEKTSKLLNIDISVTMGISIYPDNADNLEGLIKCADQSMYRLKKDSAAEGTHVI